MLIESAAEKGARVVCLPEHWIPGDDANLDDLLPLFSDMARETASYIIPGADFVRRKGGVTTIESVVINPKGEEIGRQQKVHLFRREKEVAVAGSGYSVFELDGVKVGIAICHDLVYPEVARILVLKGAEVIFAPSRIDARGIAPWELYVKARALENRIPVVSANFLKPPKYPGSSIVVKLILSRRGEGIVYPETAEKAGARQGVLVADLDFEAVKPQKIERLKARRPDTYSELLRPWNQ
jgi:predicted amidohydrolase